MSKPKLKVVNGSFVEETRDELDKRMWKSLNNEQRKWFVDMAVTHEAVFTELRESGMCAMAFHAGQCTGYFAAFPLGSGLVRLS